MLTKRRLVVRIYVIFIVTLLCWRHALKLHDEAMLAIQAMEINPPSILYSKRAPAHSKWKLGNSTLNTMHFVQISDIHVSRYSTHGGLKHLESFIYNELPLIAPDAVVATGDITDGIEGFVSVQHRAEWAAYHRLLRTSRVLDRSFWWDMRGNHDCFNVPSYSHSQNMYMEYGATKQEGYSFIVNKTFGTYAFIGLDACPETGPSKPLNFFGYLDYKDMNLFADALYRSVSNGYNHTFGMTHYPLGCLLLGKTRGGLVFWHMSQHVTLWLSGHLHKIVGDRMYAYHGDSGLLELELGDLKSNGMFRVVAVDHDLVSFRDFAISAHHLPIDHDASYQWVGAPLVLITNPKDGKFLLRGKEPLDLIPKSTHIRVLIWSPRPIVAISAFIDDVQVDSEAVYIGQGAPWSSIQNVSDNQPYTPMWVIAWDPDVYNDDSMHTLTVSAVDETQVSGNHTIEFRLDGHPIDMNAGVGGFFISLHIGVIVFLLI